MRHNKFICTVTAIVMTLGVCQAAMPSPASTVSAAGAATVVRLDPSEASPFNNGKFEGWGTALCWWANRIGYDETLTQAAADAFFSDEGLGLDIARYNIGGGDDPAHTHITRSDSAVPGYWGSYTASGDGKDVTITYDWTKDENQRNVAQAALEANPDLYFEGFSNSAPYFMTTSGCTSGGDPASADNLKTDMYDDFAKYIAETTKHFKDDFGIEFKSYSPMNEPDTDYWGVNSPKQEGCHFDPGTSQSNMIIETRKALDAAGLTDVLVAGMDETDINKSVTNFGKLTEEAKTALGRIDTHTYNGSNRAGLKQTAMNANKNLWQSEVDGGWNGFDLANRIITDLNGMQASAWVMWNIVDSHKDSTTFEYPAGSGTHPEANNSLNVTGSLWGVGMADHDTKELKLANKYYAFGQFTKYINPGDTLIASSGSTLAAYSRTSGDIKIVVNNSGSSDIPYTFDLAAFKTVGNTVKEIRSNNLTDGNAEHWKPITGEAELQGKKLVTTAKAGTITTYVISGSGFAPKHVNTYDAEVTANQNGLSYSYTLPVEAKGKHAYFAVYDSSNKLKYLSVDKNNDTVSGDFSGCTHKLLVWEGMTPFEYDTSPEYAIIKGGGNEIAVGASAELTLETNMTGDVTWSVSDATLADIAPNGKTAVVTAKAAGNVTVYAQIGDFKVERSFLIPSYRLSGTASWNNVDSTDYRQVTDGSFDTYFDGLTNGWVTYDYGKPYKVSEIKLAARGGGDTYAARTVGGEVQASNDGINWTTLHKITSALSATAYTTLTAEQLGLSGNNKAYRYYRYTNSDHEANISEFIITGTPSDNDNIPEGDPTVNDIAEFTDNFEGNENIFDAAAGDLTTDGNQIFASGLERFGNVFVPVKDTGKSEPNEAITLTDKDRFRMRLNMFSGWEDSGAANTFAINDEDGNEVVALKITGGGYTLEELRVGGTNILSGKIDGSAQCKTSASKGANGWDQSSQRYQNNVGYNKTLEILIDGTGTVKVSFTGGNKEDVAAAEGAIDVSEKQITIGSIELTGDYKAARGRTVSYDNLDADVITYSAKLPDPPKPLEIPADGTLISLDFNNNLESGSTYGKATALGTPVYETVDGKQALKLDNTNDTAIKLTDANGKGLLAGQDEITVSFSVKPTEGTKASWWFYSAPNDNAQADPENYIGVFRKPDGKTLSVERYKNGRSDTTDDGNFTLNAWHDVVISFAKDKTTLYVDGAQKDSDASTFAISEMLGTNSVAYIGRANWGDNHEFATGYIDDFKIVQGALKSALDDIDLGDLSAVKGNLTLPTKDGSITWTSSNTEVISTAGVVTRPAKTTTVKLTASVTENGLTSTRTFDVVVVGTTSSAYLFAHFVGNESSAEHEQIYFSVSQTGTSWTTLNGGKPVLTSNVGEKGVRDPYILRGKDDKFYIIATDLSIYNRSSDANRWDTCQKSGSKNIVVWESSDLVNWEDARLAEVGSSNAGCVWAPEAVYDSEEGKYMVFWASKTATDNYTTQRMYRSYTNDFTTFTEPEIYIDGGTVSNIDTTIVEENGVYYRFTKNETKSSVTMMKAESLNGPWTDVDTYKIDGVAGNTVTGYEGPTIYKNNDGGWTLLLDEYTGQGYKPFVTNDLSTGVFTSAGDFTFDAKYRHGTVMPISQDEYDALIAEYPNS